MSRFVPSPSIGLSGGGDGNGMTGGGGCGNVGNFRFCAKDGCRKEEGGRHEFMSGWYLGDGRSSGPVIVIVGEGVVVVEGILSCSMLVSVCACVYYGKRGNMVRNGE